MSLPFFSQELPTSCVAACVRMVLAALGHTLTEEEIRVRCDHSALGMRLNRVAEGLADLHVVVKYESDWGLDDLRDVVRTRATPIVAIDLRPVEGIFAFHAVVILDITAEQVTAHDPLYQEGFRSISLTTFEAAWNKADRETVIILPDLMSLAI